MKPVLPTYALVANRASASLYRTRGPGVAPELVRRFEHPEGRLKAGEIDTDRPGRGFASDGGRHAFSHEESPTEHVAREFASQLAGDLDRARTNGEFDEVALIAPPRMLGYLRDALSAPTRELVYAELAKDIDQLDAMDLRRHLDQFARA